MRPSNQALIKKQWEYPRQLHFLWLVRNSQIINNMICSNILAESLHKKNTPSSACSMGKATSKTKTPSLFWFWLSTQFTPAEGIGLTGEAFCEDVWVRCLHEFRSSDRQGNHWGNLRFLQAGLTGRHSFAYFSVAVDRKVSRFEGETIRWKDRKLIKKNKQTINPKPLATSPSLS